MKYLATMLVTIGITQGLFVSVVLLLDRRYSSTNTKLLSQTILLFSLQGILDLLAFWKIGEHFLWMEIIGYFGLQGLIFLPYFFSVLRSLKKQLFLPNWVLFVPFILSTFYGVLASIVVLFKVESLWLFLEILWDIHWYSNIGLVLLLDIIVLRFILNASRKASSLEGPVFTWLGLSLIIFIWLIINILNLFFDSEVYHLFSLISFWGSVTLLIFWFTYQGVFQQRLISEKKSLHLILKEKFADGYRLSQQSTSANPYIIHLEELLSKHKLYRKPNLNRQGLAKKLGISPGYLSKIIQEETQQSLSELINEYRVNETRKILEDGSLNHFSLEAIGSEVGFNSRSAFFFNFKKLTGLTPADYKEKFQS